MTEALHKLQYVVTGHKYSGTKYAAELLTSVGVPCVHESFHLENGEYRQPDRTCVAESCCFISLHLEDPALIDAGIIHLVRHPLLVLRNLLAVQPNIQAAMEHWLTWNLHIESYSDQERYTRIRIDDCPEALLAAVGKLNRVNDCFRPEKIEDPEQRAKAMNSKWYFNKQAFPYTSLDELPGGPQKQDLIAMAERYGFGAEPEIETRKD